MKAKMLLGMVLLSMGTEMVAAESAAGRAGYSFFGAGSDFMDYEENTTRQIGGKTIDVETSIGLNFTQQSGAYVAVNQDWGFYLVTASTLGESGSDEAWQIDDITVRTNKVAFERQRLGVLATYRLGSKDFLLLGAQYGSTEFKRFAARLTPQAVAFGITDTTFSDGTVSENVWDFSAVAGYEWNTLFNSAAPGWRYQLQLIAGIPLSTSITNTDVNEGDSFSAGFNGLQLRLNWVYGYQFSENVLAAFSLELGFARRNPISRDFTDASGVTEFPENTLIYSYPSLVVYWSF
ncbi:MAG: hypothetical protein H8E21_03550 [Gammaproteobacteria bacterium]|nr:hypothetical protein [Gammaproteobacteria bacterium]MBL6999316.1 hypothetical protein [Gammaproteobacteria bacterium]